MYNRYIPQPDGSYRRNRIQEHSSIPGPQPPPPPMPEPPKPPESPCRAERPRHSPPRRPAPQREFPRKESFHAGGFLKQLLPADLETEDLLVVLLLLLMAGDGQEPPGTALLTLALYLFL